MNGQCEVGNLSTKGSSTAKPTTSTPPKPPPIAGRRKRGPSARLSGPSGRDPGMRLADDPSLVVPGIGTGAISLDLAVEDEVVAKSQA